MIESQLADFYKILKETKESSLFILSLREFFSISYNILDSSSKNLMRSIVVLETLIIY